MCAVSLRGRVRQRPAGAALPAALRPVPAPEQTHPHPVRALLERHVRQGRGANVPQGLKVREVFQHVYIFFKWMRSCVMYE